MELQYLLNDHLPKEDGDEIVTNNHLHQDVVPFPARRPFYLRPPLLREIYGARRAALALQNQFEVYGTISYLEPPTQIIHKKMLNKMLNRIDDFLNRVLAVLRLDTGTEHGDLVMLATYDYPCELMTGECPLTSTLAAGMELRRMEAVAIKVVKERRAMSAGAWSCGNQTREVLWKAPAHMPESHSQPSLSLLLEPATPRRKTKCDGIQLEPDLTPRKRRKTNRAVPLIIGEDKERLIVEENGVGIISGFTLSEELQTDVSRIVSLSSIQKVISGQDVEEVIAITDIIWI